MPRSGSGVYSVPPGTYGVPDETVASTPYNSNIDDVATDLNTPRPIVAGGTGATSAAQALTNLGGVAKAGDTMTGRLLVMAGSGPSSYVSQISVGTYGGTYPGGSLISNSPGQILVSAGGEFLGNQWIARSPESLLFGGIAGQFDLYTNTGLTSGVSYTPTSRFTISSNGNAFFRSTTASSSPTTGALTVAGGLGISGTINAGAMKVGTGTSLFSAQLKVTETSGGAYTEVSDGIRSIVIGADGVGGWIGTYTNDQFVIRSNNTARITVSAGGTTNVYAQLAVGTQYPMPGFGANLLIGYAGGGTQYGMAMRPTADSTYAIVFCNAAGTNIGSISQTASNIAVNGTSDIRLKTDLRSFDSGAILDRLIVYDFAWKSTGERAHGVAAQEAVKVYPAAITYMEKEDWWGVDNSKFIPLLLQEIKMLRTRVAALEARLA